MAVIIAVLSTLMAAFLNALSSVLQRKAAGAPHPKALFSKKFMLELSKNKLWLYGLGLQILAAAGEAMALYEASLVLVQPLMTVDLVFLLLILHFYFGLKSGVREWSAVAAILVGLSMLLTAAHPHSGHLQFNGLHWIILSAIIVGIMVSGALIMRGSESHKVRAAAGGVACSVNYALTAGFVKLMLDQIHLGVGNIFLHWPVYAFMVSGAISLLMAQNTFAAGSLTVSHPIIEIIEPVASALIGVIMLGEVINTHPGNVVVEVVGALLAVCGIALMSSSNRLQNPQIQKAYAI